MNNQTPYHPHIGLPGAANLQIGQRYRTDVNTGETFFVELLALNRESGATVRVDEPRNRKWHGHTFHAEAAALNYVPRLWPVRSRNALLTGYRGDASMPPKDYNPKEAKRLVISGNGFKGGEVACVPGYTAGFLIDGALYKPSLAAVRRLIPARLRPAFDRAGEFWFNAHDQRQSGHLHLYNQRGGLMTTIYVAPPLPKTDPSAEAATSQ